MQKAQPSAASGGRACARGNSGGVCCEGHSRLPRAAGGPYGLSAVSLGGDKFRGRGGIIEEYKLVRSRRKTLAIHVTPQGELEVRAPLRLSKTVIEGFVAQKSGWITEHLAAARQRESARANFYPEALPLLGHDYPVRRGAVKKPQFDGACFTLPQGDWKAVRAGAAALYRALALPLLQERTARYSALLGVAPTAVKVNSAAARWGSCSGKNSLNFSWRLILAHPDAVDYVVVHELAHILQHNHSPAFWQVVAGILPDYKRRQGLLKALHRRMAAENWE